MHEPNLGASIDQSMSPSATQRRVLGADESAIPGRLLMIDSDCWQLANVANGQTLAIAREESWSDVTAGARNAARGERWRWLGPVAGS